MSANPYNLNDQDFQDLQQIQSQLKQGDPRYGKITALLATKPAPQEPPVNVYKAPAGAANATVSAQPGGLRGYLDNLESDVRYGGQTTLPGRILHSLGAQGINVGAQAGVGDTALTTPITGPIHVAQGVAQLPSDPLSGTAKMLKGTLETATIPAAFAGAGSAAKVADVSKYTAPIVYARQIAKSINPPAAEYRGLEDALSKEAGNIKDFASKTGNPLSTLQDLEDAAYGSSKQVRGIYQQRILDPIKSERVSAPPSFQGARIGEGQQTTIGNLDKRASDINALLRSNYMKRTLGQQGEAMANDADLKSELAAVDDALYSEISKRTGLTEKQVAELRQTMGRQFQIGYQTEGAKIGKIATARGSAENSGIKLSPGQVGMDVLNKAFRGGPVGVANKATSKALSAADISPTELPTQFGTPTTQTPGRIPIYQQLGLDTQGQAVPSTADKFTPQSIAEQLQVNSSKRQALQDALKQQNLSEASRRNLNMAMRKIGK